MVSVARPQQSWRFLHWTFLFHPGCLFGHHFCGLCCWKTHYSPVIGKMWLPPTIVNLKTFWRQKAFYKSESLSENEVVESSPNDMSVLEGPQTETEVAIAGSAESVPRTILEHRPQAPYKCYFQFWLRPWFWRISSNFFVLMAEKSLLFWLCQAVEVCSWEWRVSALWKWSGLRLVGREDEKKWEPLRKSILTGVRGPQKPTPSNLLELCRNFGDLCVTWCIWSNVWPLLSRFIKVNNNNKKAGRILLCILIQILCACVKTQSNSWGKWWSQLSGAR